MKFFASSPLTHLARVIRYHVSGGQYNAPLAASLHSRRAWCGRGVGEIKIEPHWCIVPPPTYSEICVLVYWVHVSYLVPPTVRGRLGWWWWWWWVWGWGGR